jgi:signal transduction histidine kinase
LRARRGIEIELDLCSEPDVAHAIKEALYRIAQEALQNAAKHARADRLKVRLVPDPAGLKLEVCDNGVGFDPLAGYPGHLGLRSMRERATKMGGTLDIVSAPDCGTQILAFIPVSVAQAT